MTRYLQSLLILVILSPAGSAASDVGLAVDGGLAGVAYSSVSWLGRRWLCVGLFGSPAGWLLLTTR